MPNIEGSSYRETARPSPKNKPARPSGRRLGTGSGYSDWLNQLEDMLFAQYGQGGGQSRGYVGGGGGGGGYDPFSFERQRLAELDKRKKMLTGQLEGAKKAALPLLSNYGREYRGSIDRIYAQNRAQNKGYTDQLRALGGQMTSGAKGELAGLQRDLGAQGAGGADMAALRAAANQNIQGQQFLTNNADSFNRRLAQVMANSGADARAMGAAIGTSGKSQLENSYLQALMQIQLLGLT